MNKYLTGSNRLRAGSRAQQKSRHRAAVGANSIAELHLKLLMLAVFLPEGFSFFVGDLRLSPARAFLIFLTPIATYSFLKKSSAVRVPSDFFALATGVWIILALTVTKDLTYGLKGGGALALDFTGTYYVFRNLLGPINSSVRVMRFSCKLIIIVICIALLDPLTGKPFTYEVVKGLTGYVKPGYEWAIGAHSTSMFRSGLVRAQGPLEHSILFGAACAWFGILGGFTFLLRPFGIAVTSGALIGILFSQSKAALLCAIMGVGLVIFNYATKKLLARWVILGALVFLAIVPVLLFSGKPEATILKLLFVDPATQWYREEIWGAASPLVAQSPIFGIGLTADWNWQNYSALAGGSVDSLWLRSAMSFGIPGSVLIFLTMVSAFWLGPVDKCNYLSREEKQLSVALGFVTTTAVFLGLTADFYGSCWILIAAFAGIRANLAEAAILRRKSARGQETVGTRLDTQAIVRSP